MTLSPLRGRLGACLVATSVAGAAGLAMPAHAQGGASALEEIVVTARKREESLQDIPIAISAFTAEQIENRGITRLEDLTLQASRQTGRVLRGGGAGPRLGWPHGREMK